MDEVHTLDQSLALGLSAIEVIAISGLVKLCSRGYPRATWDFGLVFLNAVDSATLKSVLNNPLFFIFEYSFGPIPWVDYVALVTRK